MVDLIEVTLNSNRFVKMQYVSFEGKTVIDLPLSNEPNNVLESDSSIKKCFEEECRGFNPENYKVFLKFVDAIHKEKV